MTKTKWLPFPHGPHEGETCPQVFLADPAYLLCALKSGEFDGPLLDQARDVCERAARVWVPLDDADDPDVTVFYFLLPNANFSGYAFVHRSDPEFENYERCAVTGTWKYLDLTMAMRIAPGDPGAPMFIINALKYRVLGDPHAALTREQCEGFFDDAENFVDCSRIPSGFSHVWLRQGTRFRYLDELEPGAFFHILDHYQEVEVLKLAFESGETAFYLMNGRVISVDYDDDVKDEPDASVGDEPDTLPDEA